MYRWGLSGLPNQSWLGQTGEEMQEIGWPAPFLIHKGGGGGIGGGKICILAFYYIG